MEGKQYYTALLIKYMDGLASPEEQEELFQELRDPVQQDRKSVV